MQIPRRLLALCFPLALLLPIDAEARGEVIARLRTGGEKEPTMRLGRNFKIDGEMAERLANVDGLANVSIAARQRASHLRLVA